MRTGLALTSGLGLPRRWGYAGDLPCAEGCLGQPKSRNKTCLVLLLAAAAGPSWHPDPSLCQPRTPLGKHRGAESAWLRAHLPWGYRHLQPEPCAGSSGYRGVPCAPHCMCLAPPASTWGFASTALICPSTAVMFGHPGGDKRVASCSLRQARGVFCSHPVLGSWV